jgi:hypothetical protein
VARYKGIHVHEVLDALGLRKASSTVGIPFAEEIVDEQPRQPHARPLVVLDVHQALNLIQVLEVS